MRETLDLVNAKIANKLDFFEFFLLLAKQAGFTHIKPQNPPSLHIQRRSWQSNVNR